MEKELTLLEMFEEEEKRQFTLKNETGNEKTRKEIEEIKEELIKNIQEKNIPIEDISILYFYITPEDLFKSSYKIAFAYTSKPYDEPIDFAHVIGTYSKKLKQEKAIDLINKLRKKLIEEELLVRDTTFGFYKEKIFKVLLTY